MNGTVHRRGGGPGLVGFLFGVADRRSMPAAALVDLLGDLGMPPAAARRLLARMREQGQLTSHRHGRTADYALAGPFGATVARLRADGLRVETGEAVPPWPGHFHALLHQLPESRRAYRDRLRRLAVLVGYASLQPGVLISVGDRSDQIADVLADVPDDGHVRLVTVGMASDEAAAVASSAWELPALGADMTRHVAALRTVLGNPRQPVADAATLRVLADATQQVYVDLIRDPGLPAELYPGGWPGDDLRRAVGEIAASHVAPAGEHILARLDEHESGTSSTTERE